MFTKESFLLVLTVFFIQKPVQIKYGIREEASMLLKTLLKEICLIEWKTGFLSTIAYNYGAFFYLPLLLHCIYKIQF